MTGQAKRQRRAISGWLVLDKPYDMTSTQAVGKLRWLFWADKAGHAGTLDPLATGILPIAFGEATKTVPLVQDGLKRYGFSLKWGEATLTDDAEGEVVATSPNRPTREQVEAILPSFTGTIIQVPPAFSAIMIAGERAYDLARAGKAPVMTPREIVVHTLKLLDHGPDASNFEIACEKGTYVRALARDVALALNTCGHISALRRTGVGAFLEGEAVSIEQLEQLEQDERDKLLLPLSAGLQGTPEVALSPDEAQAVRHGNPVLLRGAGAPLALVRAWASSRGRPVALGVVEAGQFKPNRVFV